MRLSKSLTFICLTLFSLTFAFAQQDFQGKAYYSSKTSVDMDQWGGREMSPERKKNDHGSNEEFS